MSRMQEWSTSGNKDGMVKRIDAKRDPRGGDGGRGNMSFCIFPLRGEITKGEDHDNG